MTPQQHINEAEELLRMIDTLEEREEIHRENDVLLWQMTVDRANLHIAVARAQLEAL